MKHSKIIHLLFLIVLLITPNSWNAQDTCEVERKLLAPIAQPVEFLGADVDISGNYAIAGAIGNDQLGVLAGSAEVFEKQGSEWVPMQTLTATDGSPNDRFGRSVAIWGDYAIVGAPFDDIAGPFSGSAYIFHKIGQAWIQEVKLSPDDGLASDRFGWTVDIWEDYAVICSLNDYTENQTLTGSAYFFHREDDGWVQINKVFPEDGGNFDEFGYSISMEDNYAIVGSPSHDSLGVESGAAYLYENQDTAWVFKEKIVASDGSSGAKFGNSVSLSESFLTISAYHDIVNDVDTSGAVYSFQIEDESWVEQQKIITPETTLNMEFGVSSGHQDNRMVITTVKANTPGVSQSGAAFIYEYNGSEWEFERKIMADDPENGDFYGISCAMNGSKIIIGALGEDTNGGAAGAAYVHYLDCEPVCTSISSPQNGAFGVPLDTDISWFPVNDATAYIVSVGTSPGGVDVVDNLNVGDILTYDFANDLSVDTDYYVSIIPENSAGSANNCIESEFSTSVILMTMNVGADVTIPCYEPVPIESYILNNVCDTETVTVETEITPGDCDQEYTIVRTYTATDGCTSVSDVQTIIVDDIDGPEFNNVPIAVTIACGEDLPTDVPTATDDCDEEPIVVTFVDDIAPACGEIIVRTFSATDQCGNTRTSTQLITIESGGDIPSCATLLSPSGMDVPLNVDLIWSEAEAAEGYLLTIGTTFGGNEILDNEDVNNVLTYNLSDLDPATTYYVSLIPYNTVGNAAFCSEYEFTTIALPECVGLINPDGSSLVYPELVLLEWNASADADGYLLTLGTSAGGNDLLDSFDVGNVLSYTLDLPETTDIYVSVIAYNAIGNADTCEEFSFTTDLLIGIAEFSLEDRITVYPNPNDGQYINVSIDNKNVLLALEEIRLVDPTGRIITQFSSLQLQQNHFQIRFDNGLEEGLYLVQLRGSGVNLVKSFVVQ